MLILLIYSMDSNLNYSKFVSAGTFDRIRRLHKEFIDEMHPHFGVPNPTYVEKIQFLPLLWGGGYGFDKDGSPVIFFNDLYTRTDPDDKVFGSLALDYVMLHESAHHLHGIKHGIFDDTYTLEFLIDYSAIHYLKLKGMQKHLDAITERNDDCLIVRELHDEYDEIRSIKSILTAPQKEARKFIVRALKAQTVDILKGR